MAFLLNKSDMASSIGISVQAFDKWGVPPVERRGREVFYDVKTVLEIDRERRQQNQKSSGGENDLEERLLKARVNLTEEQAISQRLKNQVAEHKVIDTAFSIFALSRLWALANDMNCSAGQLLASAASRRLVTQTARTGSIGVMMAHSNYGAALEKQGVEITLIYSGSHKVDGNPYSHLPDDVRETLQSRMDATRRMFAQKVSAYTGLSVQAVLDTEAAVYSGQEAIDAGLADELVNSTDAITVMRDALDARKSRLSGGRMTKETQSTTVSATASQTDVTDVVPATEGENASAAQPDVNAQITAAVAAENSRIMGILNCEEAHGREEQARVLAETPGMTVETARRILAAAPQSAQARSDTALDRLMQGAPAPLAAGNPASDAVNDLLNTPV